MTMGFQSLKSVVEGQLSFFGSADFVTVGDQERRLSAYQLRDNLRMVQVFYQSGNFSKSGSGFHGPVRHEVVLRLDLLAAKSAVGDVSTLDNPASTDGQRKTALGGFGRATYLADQSFDILVEKVYQILMDNLAYEYSTVSTPVSSRWVPSVNKDQPIEMGEYVVITGSMTFTCVVTESLRGATPVVATDVIDVTIDPNVDIDDEIDDDTEKTGVTVDL